MLFWICVGLSALAACILVFYVYEKCKAYSVKSVLIKFIVSSLFIAVALLAAYQNKGQVINPFIIFGLLLGLSGDIWLDLKYVHKEYDKIYSYAGFIVFGIGHIFFITGMYLQFFNGNNVLYIILPIIGGVVISIINQLLAIPLKINFGDMKMISIAYSVTLFSLPLCALSLCILTAWSSMTLIMLFIGGLLFAISDIVLSQTCFKEGHETPTDFIFNYLFYYGAQFIIAFSIFFL